MAMRTDPALTDRLFYDNHKNSNHLYYFWKAINIYSSLSITQRIGGNQHYRGVRNNGFGNE